MTATVPSRLRTRLATLAILAATLVTGPALAQMIPIEDIRENSADATFLGVTQSFFEYPSAPFAYFNSFVNPFVPNPDPQGPGFAEATAFQVSEFFPGGINVSGSTSGGWQILAGNYSALSHAQFRFRVDTCFEYQLDSWLLPGDLGEARIDVAVPHTSLAYQNSTAGEIHTTGRLPAGTYDVEGHSYIISNLEHVDGPTYSIIWTCRPCITTLIASHPRSLAVACGGTAVFTVGPTIPHGTLTYQWRRNLVPLTDNGHFVGAGTPMLTINNACNPDSGYYDVVLSDGTIIEPSQLAHLGIATTTDVEVAADLPQRAFSLEVAGPNPFGGSTSFRYAMAKPQLATIDIYNASGAKIRSLSKGMMSGSGTFSWDGTTSSGARAPAGIYFVKFRAGSVQESRKVVVLR